MALRRIVLQGEDCLTKVCRPVTDFDNRLHILLNDMADTLLDSGGVGLAAPQVGILRRVCVVQNENDEIIELINPEIVYTQGEQTGLEGCLSVPGKFGVVTARTSAPPRLGWRRSRGSLMLSTSGAICLCGPRRSCRFTSAARRRPTFPTAS